MGWPQRRSFGPLGVTRHVFLERLGVWGVGKLPLSKPAFGPCSAKQVSEPALEHKELPAHSVICSLKTREFVVLNWFQKASE